MPSSSLFGISSYIHRLSPLSLLRPDGYALSGKARPLRQEHASRDARMGMYIVAYGIQLYNNN